MDNFEFYSPTFFQFGRDSEKETARLIKRFGGKKVLLHYGSGSVKRTGIYDKVIKILDEGEICYIELGGVEANPKLSKVYEGIELCKKENIDFVLALGGGSVIDSAKAIALGAVYDGDVWDFYDRSGKIEACLPLGTILTIPAAGSEASPASVITKEEGKLKWDIDKNDLVRPKFAILNPEFTFSLPDYQTACGVTDMMAHIIERYFTHTKGVEVTDQISEGILRAIIKAGRAVTENPNDYEARCDLMWSGALAHNNLCGVGRAQDWASHAMEMELSAQNDCAHGAGLAVILPAWLTYTMHEDIDRSARFAHEVWGVPCDFGTKEEITKEGIKRFKEFLKFIGMPLTLGELDLGQEHIPVFLERRALRGFGFGGFKKIYEEDMKAIYELCL